MSLGLVRDHRVKRRLGSDPNSDARYPGVDRDHPADGYRELYKPNRNSRDRTRTTSAYSGSGYNDQYSRSTLEREDILQNRNRISGNDYDYWDSPTIDYDAGEYLPDDAYYDPQADRHGYDNQGYTDPGRVHGSGSGHKSGTDSEHRYAHERWTRGRYGIGTGIGVGLPEYWTDRDGNYDRTLEAQYPEQEFEHDYYDDDYEMGYKQSQYSDGYYVDAPDFYRERYTPKEESLRRLYVRMFKNIEYNIKVPLMQIIASITLFIIFIANYSLDIFSFEYVVAIGSFSPYVDPTVHPPAVAAIFATMFGIFLIIFPTMNKDIKRIVIILTILFLIILFAGPALIAWSSTSELEQVGLAFADSIFEFLKLIAVLVYWAPMFLGIYGIWTRNSFYIGASAMFLFLTIVILDIYLFYEGLPIEKIRGNWVYYVLFAVILFCYMELSDSAITFSNFTSVKDKQSIDPIYYEHLDKIIEKYFVYLFLFTGFTLFLGFIALNFNELLRAIGSTQVAESIEISSIYGTIIALFVLGLGIIIFGLIIRYEQVIRKGIKRLVSSFSAPKPAVYARGGMYSSRSTSWSRSHSARAYTNTSTKRRHGKYNKSKKRR